MGSAQPYLGEVDEHGVGHPPQSGKKIAEAEPPARPEGRQQPPDEALGRIAGGPVEQPDQHGKRNQADGIEIVWCLRERRERAGHQGDRMALPPPKKDDAARKTGQKRSAVPAARRGGVRGLAMARRNVQSGWTCRHPRKSTGSSTSPQRRNQSPGTRTGCGRSHHRPWEAGMTEARRRRSRQTGRRDSAGPRGRPRAEKSTPEGRRGPCGAI